MVAMDTIALARAIHVVAVVIWIGGMAMATTVVLPAVRRGDLGPDPRRAFQAIEHRFVWQARAGVLLVGASGLYMVEALGLWDHFQSIAFWWMHAMACLWAIFAFLLFVAEPLILHRHFKRWSGKAPATAFSWLHRTHWLLLVLSIITVFGAVAGSHGWQMF